MKGIIFAPQNYSQMNMCVKANSGFPAGLAVKNLHAKQETWVWSLGQEDLLKKEMATHSNILASEIPRTE